MSIAAQTRPVQRIHIVADGSKVRSCAEEMERFISAHPELDAVYTYVSNNGKREAQAVAFRTPGRGHLRHDGLRHAAGRAGDRERSAALRQAQGDVGGRDADRLNRRHSLLTRLVDLAGHTDSTLNTRACHSWRRRRHQHAEAKGAAELVGGVDPVT
jgi:hypothetical protein